jgi:hypothetical protein
MARGGKRANAGRKAGAATKKTREIAEKAAENGVTPLEYMLEVMRSPVPKELAEHLSDPKKKLSVEVIASLFSWHSMRFEAAKAAAPYVHPRLQTTTVKGPGPNGEIPHRVVIEFVD